MLLKPRWLFTACFLYLQLPFSQPVQNSFLGYSLKQHSFTLYLSLKGQCRLLETVSKAGKGTCLKYSNFKKSSLLILLCNSPILVINTKLYGNYSPYILNKLMDFVQDKVMKSCNWHCGFVFSLCGKRGWGGETKSKNKDRRYFQGASAF